MLRLLLLVLPLGLDTFAVSALLGLGGLPSRKRLRVSLLFSAFEAVMPLVGVLVGHGLAHTRAHRSCGSLVASRSTPHGYAVRFETLAAHLLPDVSMLEAEVRPRRVGG